MEELNLKQLLLLVDAIAEEKGLEKDRVLSIVEQAIAAAWRRDNVTRDHNVRAELNTNKGEATAFVVRQVVEQVEDEKTQISLKDAQKINPKVELDGVIEEAHPVTSFGRVAAQTAKQVIMQRMREAEQEVIYNQFKDRKGELISGSVRRFEKGNIIVDLEHCDAILPTREQTPRESYRSGDRVLAYIKHVQRNSRDPQVVLSRSEPMLVAKLFEQEVPEIFEGIVRIIRVAREPGLRSKVAVYSRDSDVDPVGACVGMRGARVQAVVQELRGEKIDIVPFHEEAARFVCSAISPAEVTKVLIDESTAAMELIVPDDQLSLAIGRGGQNVRLASQLTGWNLDIISETRLQNLMREAKAELMSYDDVTEDMIDTLFTLGYNKLEHIAQAHPQELGQIPGFGLENAERIIDVSAEILERQEEMRNLNAAAVWHKDELLEINGVNDRMAGMLLKAGYRSPEIIALESDVNRLDLRAGTGLKKAGQLVRNAMTYVLSIDGYNEDMLTERREKFIKAWEKSPLTPADVVYEQLFGKIRPLSEVFGSHTQEEDVQDAEQAQEIEPTQEAEQAQETTLNHTEEPS